MDKMLDKLGGWLVVATLAVLFVHTGGVAFHLGMVGAGFMLAVARGVNRDNPGEYYSYSLACLLGAVGLALPALLLWCVVLVVA